MSDYIEESSSKLNRVVGFCCEMHFSRGVQVEAMSKLVKMKVLVVGLNGIGIEVAKVSVFDGCRFARWVYNGHV